MVRMRVQPRIKPIRISRFQILQIYWFATEKGIHFRERKSNPSLSS